jgi:TPR repeat protein
MLKFSPAFFLVGFCAVSADFNSEAQKLLREADDYYFGDTEIPQNYSKALASYKKAANLGSTQALFNVGYCYENGEGATRDFVLAAKYYKEAAQNDHPDALFHLARLHETGGGVEQNYLRAANLYSRASERGHADAKNNLGVLYLHGTGGLPQDVDKAILLFSQAAVKGVGVARSNIDLTLRMLQKAGLTAYVPKPEHINTAYIVTKNGAGQTQTIFSQSSEITQTIHSDQ